MGACLAEVRVTSTASLLFVFGGMLGRGILTWPLGLGLVYVYVCRSYIGGAQQWTHNNGCHGQVPAGTG